MIFYTLQAATSQSAVVDVIASSVNITAANVYTTTINYNFKSYYFQLFDQSNRVVTTNVTLSVGTGMASFNNVTSYFYFDTPTTGSTLVKVTVTSDVNAVLYNLLYNLTQVSTLQLNNSIKFITDFVSNTMITGTNINGTCIGTCYL